MEKNLNLKQDFTVSLKPNRLYFKVIGDVSGPTCPIYYELIYDHYEEVLVEMPIVSNVSTENNYIIGTTVDTYYISGTTIHITGTTSSSEIVSFTGTTTNDANTLSENIFSGDTTNLIGTIITNEPKYEKQVKYSITLFKGNETLPTQYLIPVLNGDIQTTNAILSTFIWGGPFEGLILNI